uniref:Uncharacterized protein n=1 Tax=Physcomitrium patens TaxID=3218 RepID=A0A2K1J9N3_PHYPA|nr:hypothetical protein PHYPA_021347 [Physcomitrium patens]
MCRKCSLRNLIKSAAATFDWLHVSNLQLNLGRVAYLWPFDLCCFTKTIHCVALTYACALHLSLALHYFPNQTFRMLIYSPARDLKALHVESD